MAQLKLGELLLEHKVITEEQLTQAIQKQKQTGEKIGATLISLGYITEAQFLDFFSHQLNIPFFDLKLYSIDPAIAQALPETYARMHRAIILKKYGEGYLVGMSDPLNIIAMDELKQIINKPLSFALVKDNDLSRVLDLTYRRTKEISGFAKQLSQEITKPAPTITEKTSLANDAPVIKLLDSLFKDASHMNATDIHIEPSETGIRIRLRIDGILQEQVVDEPAIMPAIVSRLKLMSGLNISEKRIPQDGRFDIEAEGKRYDIRLSTMPTPFGESVVLRLLKQTDGILQLEQTGMHGEILKDFRELCHKPNGIILVTGPTGSGKSTTLYAAINELNQPGIKIITIEDPIEYFLPWAVQIQTNEQIGLSFSTVLRGILRHDPDVILLGEMRDKETSSIAMRTALTGRLVLSTLHTNDSISAVYRLIDLGIETYIIAATTQGILAQRLVRLICEHCIEDHIATSQEAAWLAKLNIDPAGITYKTGKGCSYCSNTGYHGRVGIFELLEFNEPMAEALRSNNTQEFHKLAKKALEGKLLADDAYRLASEGKTSLQEVIRVINEGYGTS